MPVMYCTRSQQVLRIVVYIAQTYLSPSPAKMAFCDERCGNRAYEWTNEDQGRETGYRNTASLIAEHIREGASYDS